jgi:hypothetical protein
MRGRVSGLKFLNGSADAAAGAACSIATGAIISAPPRLCANHSLLNSTAHVTARTNSGTANV